RAVEPLISVFMTTVVRSGFIVRHRFYALVVSSAYGNFWFTGSGMKINPQFRKPTVWGRYYGWQVWSWTIGRTQRRSACSRNLLHALAPLAFRLRCGCRGNDD